MSQLDILIFFIQIGLFFWLSWSLILVISNLVLPHYLMLNQNQNVFFFNLNNILLIFKMFYILLICRFQNKIIQMYLSVILSPLFSLILLLFFLVNLEVYTSVVLLFLSLFVSLICAVYTLYEVVYLNAFCWLRLQTWFRLGILDVEWSFYFDKLSIVILVLIVFISFLVHFFALNYLNEDPHIFRFFMLLSLFTIFMEILVTSGNLIQFFLGWEAVGLLSYLLINFWFTRYAASNSGLMAIIYNRVGDSVYF